MDRILPLLIKLTSPVLTIPDPPPITTQRPKTNFSLNQVSNVHIFLNFGHLDVG